MKNNFWRFFGSLPAIAVIYVPLILLLIEFRGLPIADYSLLTFGIGFIALWGGVILIIWSYVVLLKDGGASANLRVPSTRLVKSGPYEVIRNPMAVGVVSVLVGEALYFDAVYVFIWAVIVLAGIIYYVTRVEEYQLANRFGQEYISYKMDVGRWFPKVETVRRLFGRK